MRDNQEILCEQTFVAHFFNIVCVNEFNGWAQSFDDSRKRWDYRVVLEMTFYEQNTRVFHTLMCKEEVMDLYVVIFTEQRRHGATTTHRPHRRKQLINRCLHHSFVALRHYVGLVAFLIIIIITVIVIFIVVLVRATASQSLVTSFQRFLVIFYHTTPSR